MRHGAQGHRRSKGRGGGNRSGGGGGGHQGGGGRNRVHDSNGPTGRVRGTAAQVTDKYENMAKDAAASGDHILSQSYWQHAEHYRRIVASFSAAENANRPRDREDRAEGGAKGGEPRAEAKGGAKDGAESQDTPHGLPANLVADPAEGEKEAQASA